MDDKRIMVDEGQTDKQTDARVDECIDGWEAGVMMGGWVDDEWESMIK